MAGTNVLVSNPCGKGVRFPRLASVFIGRGISPTAGGVYLLAEDAVTDNASVTAENSNADSGTLANVILATAASVAGVGAGVAGGELGVFVLAAESVTAGIPFVGLVEGYYVDALVTTSGSRTPRTPLYPRANTLMQDTASAITSPACGRLLVDVGTISAALTKIHFCGLPGGFGNGPGTT